MQSLQQAAHRITDRGQQGRSRQVFVDDHGYIAADGRVFGNLGEDGYVMREPGQRLDLEHEDRICQIKAPRLLRMQRAEPSDGSLAAPDAGRLTGMERGMRLGYETELRSDAGESEQSFDVRFDIEEVHL